MNLNYDQTPGSLHSLIATADRKLHIHTVAVDYDGEVIIDPELHYPLVDVARYKYFTQIRKADMRDTQKIYDLHMTLLQTLSIQYLSMGSSDLNIAA